MQKIHLLLKRALGIPYVNRIFFFAFCVYKNVSQKNWFLYMNENYNDCHHRKTTHTFICTKSKKLRNVLIFKKPDIFQKAIQFPLRFYIQKAIHSTLRNFREFFVDGIYIQKAWHFALRDVFICKKIDTSQKARQFAIRFYIQKSGTFKLRDFSLNFWNLRRGVFIEKIQSFCVTFLYWKNNALCVTLLYTKSLTLCVTS